MSFMRKQKIKVDMSKLAPVKTERVKQNFLVAAQFSIFYLECFAFHETEPILLVIKKVPVE